MSFVGAEVAGGGVSKVLGELLVWRMACPWIGADTSPTDNFPTCNHTTPLFQATNVYFLLVLESKPHIPAVTRAVGHIEALPPSCAVAA